MSLEFKACQNVLAVFSVREPQSREKKRISTGVSPVCSESQPSEEAARAQLEAIKAQLQRSPHNAHHRRFIPVGEVMISSEKSLWSRWFGS